MDDSTEAVKEIQILVAMRYGQRASPDPKFREMSDQFAILDEVLMTITQCILLLGPRRTSLKQ